MLPLTLLVPGYNQSYQMGKNFFFFFKKSAIK